MSHLGRHRLGRWTNHQYIKFVLGQYNSISCECRWYGLAKQLSWATWSHWISTWAPLTDFCGVIAGCTLPCCPLRGRGWMYLLYPKNPTWLWLRANPTPKVRKMSITFKWLCYFWSEQAGMKLKCYWFLKKLFLPWLLPDIFRYDSPKKFPTILYAVNLWLKSVSATGARLHTALCRQRTRCRHKAVYTTR